MTIEQIKKEMEKWRDFYGGDIFYDFDSATTKRGLGEIFDEYYRFLENQNINALQDLSNLKKKLGLDIF